MLTSFVVNVDQINHMSIANDNMYTFNQRMKMYFVEFFFHPKTMLVTTMVACD
jgi:hypothetical protein